MTICEQYKKQKEWFTDSELICRHLKVNKYNLSQVENDLDIPTQTLYHCIAGRRKIPLKFIKPLKEYLKL